MLEGPSSRLFDKTSTHTSQIAIFDSSILDTWPPGGSTSAKRRRRAGSLRHRRKSGIKIAYYAKKDDLLVFVYDCDEAA